MVKVITMGKTLLKPHKVIKVSRKVEVLDDEANKDKKKDEVKETKVVSQKFPSNYQLATVVKTNNKDGVFSVGDVVAFNPKFSVNFELVKGLVIVNDFDILGPWEEVKTNEDFQG